MTAHDVAQAREDAAADLERAITALRDPLTRYLRATARLQDAIGVDVGRPCDTLIALALNAVGLTPWLDRKLQPYGRPMELRAYVEGQHRAFVKAG